MSILPTPEDQAYSRGYREACEFYQPQIDCLKAEIERLQEREAYLLREWKRAGQTRDKLQAVVDAAKVITVNTSSSDITEAGDCCVVPIAWLEDLDDKIAALEGGDDG